MFSLQHFITPALYLMPCLQALGMRDCNKGIKQVLLENFQFMLEMNIFLLVGKINYLTLFETETLFNKL